MGVLSDAHDAGMLIVPHLTWQTRASTAIFLFLLFTTLPLLLFLPLRLTAFLAGAGPFLITHPFMRRFIFAPDGGLQQSKVISIVSSQLQRILNEVSLSEKHIEAKELREIEVFQNERWARPSSSATSAANGNVIVAGWKYGDSNLKPIERRAWTREPDGSQAVGDDSSHLKIHLEPGWEYVETEDWTPDYLGRWAPSGADGDGWVYTNDAWLNPHATPLEEWQKPGMTRRRRWTRRIYRTHVI
ncbi:hypothetical protein BS47DRAFT_1356814 [Hydnum rufescens UP504]|uniref:TECPR1-like DysF domain-containing protein n=1 Tax=Hydnum rufescens UP504 TaxID=1448309 RepID=A0A9P6AAD6_9AGAM|nr:hypothetical protein BS47DRAFT_1356814 [Hydnum rufescens UP504]